MRVSPVSRLLAAVALGALVAPAAVPGIGLASSAGRVTPRSVTETYARPASGVFQFEGHGWGHGHGMSQWGAQGAATLGKTWQQIVAFYYPTTTVQQVPASQDSIRVWLSGDDETDLRVLPATDLRVSDTATGTTAVLAAAAGVDMWRVTQTAAAQQVQQRVAGVWQPYAINGVTDFAGPLEFSRPSAGWLTVALPGDKPANYRGVLRAARTSPSTMDTVDVLSMDDYLKGVVPHESPASFLPEALNAQAVTARTYAAYKRAHAPGLSSGKFYDICDTTNCQVYGGMTGEAASSNAAVSATTGQVILYNGQPAFTEFSSSNGGWSTDGGTPYLIAQADPWDGVVPNGEHTWTGQITVAQLEAAYPAVGHLEALTVVSRDGNGDWGGRVLAVQLTGTGAGGAPTTVNVTGRDVYLAHAWPSYQKPDGLRSSWWHITNLDARVVAVDPAPALVHTSEREGRETLTARLLVQGSETFDGTALTLVPVAGTAAAAAAPGHFVRNVTAPGSLTVGPGQTFEMALDVNASALDAGTYPLNYRLSDGVSTFGDTVTWQLVVRAPLVAATFTTSMPGTPPALHGRTVVISEAGISSVTVTVRNTGNVTWPLDGSIVLSTSPAGRVSASAASTWASPDTPGALRAVGQSAVPPGASAQVVLDLAGNGAPFGSTSEAFGLTSPSLGAIGAGFALTVRRVDPVIGLGRLAASPSAYVDSAGRLVAVTSGTDARAQSRTRGATAWTRAASLGGPVVGRPTAVQAAAGVLTIARGLDGQLWIRPPAGGAWRPGGIAIRDEPAAAALPDGRVLLAARGSDDTIRTATWSPSAGVGPWVRVGGAQFASGVAATRSSAGIFLSAVSRGGALWANRLAAGRWVGWARVGVGASDSAPAFASVPGSLVVYLFVRGTDGALHGWKRSALGSWGSSFGVGGTLLSGPAAVAISAATLVVLARFSDGRVHARQRGPAGWLPWTVAF